MSHSLTNRWQHHSLFASKRSVHKCDVRIEVNISVALLQHTHGTKCDCWCINATTAAKELIRFLILQHISFCKDLIHTCYVFLYVNSYKLIHYHTNPFITETFKYFENMWLDCMQMVKILTKFPFISV
jgi:hypothetical protein